MEDFWHAAAGDSLSFAEHKKAYRKVISHKREYFDLLSFDTVIEVAAGTGALSSVMADHGMRVTAIERAGDKLNEARQNTRGQNIHFVQADVFPAIPFQDKIFDLAVTSFLAHSLSEEERLWLYKEMARVSKYQILIYDYADSGIRDELFYCNIGLDISFVAVEQIMVDELTAWYVATPAG